MRVRVSPLPLNNQSSATLHLWRMWKEEFKSLWSCVQALHWDYFIYMNEMLMSPEARSKLRLEKTIRDFKSYDKKRQTYVRQMESANAELNEINSRLKLEVQTLNAKIDMLIDAYDNAPPMKDNSGNRAYVKELLDKLKDKPTATLSLEDIDSVLAHEVVALRKGHSTLQLKLNELRKENKMLKSKIKLS